MATNAQLLKAQKNGLEIRVGDKAGNIGGKVEYRPSMEGDRRPWVYTGPEGTGHYRAGELIAVAPMAEEPVPAVAETKAVPVAPAKGSLTPTACGCYAELSHRRECSENAVEVRIAELKKIRARNARLRNKARKLVSA